ncbi:MAG: RNA polymerase sigma factor [bacterium]
MERNLKGLINLEAILEKARQLDETALATLTKEFYPVVFRYFYYRTKVKEDAEDLASEVFVRLVGSIKTQKGDFTAWLFRIARNLLIDYYRKRGRLKETSLEQMGNESLPDFHRYDKDTLHAEDIKKMLSFLTDEQREVITLKFLEGYSNEEIAQIMNKSAGAVKALQFRALSALRDILKKESWYKK